MATIGTALGLVPAALASGIRSEAQKPLARVVVGGMLTAAFLILFVVPILYHLTTRLSLFKRPPGPESANSLSTASEEHAEHG
jgi:Cu/Ag efflux pump CusA